MDEQRLRRCKYGREDSDNGAGCWEHGCSITHRRREERAAHVCSCPIRKDVASSMTSRTFFLARQPHESSLFNLQLEVLNFFSGTVHDTLEIYVVLLSSIAWLFILICVTESQVCYLACVVTRHTKIVENPASLPMALRSNSCLVCARLTPVYSKSSHELKV